MTLKQLVRAGRFGQRIRKAFVAGVLLACTHAAWRMVRDPFFDGWWDAFNWPQLFLYAPVLFLCGASVWQLICLIAEWSYRAAKRKLETAESIESLDVQRGLTFWLQDSLRICALYVAACLIGDIPMAVKYLAGVRGLPIHWWWSSAVTTCALLMVVVWWILDQTIRQTYSSISGVPETRGF